MNRLSNSAKALMFVPALLIAGAHAASAKQALSADLRNQATALHYVACLAKADARMDDRISDPSLVAARIAPLCAEDFAREETAFGNGLSQSDRVAYLNLMQAQMPQLALNVVMSERAWTKTHGTRSQRIAESN